MDLTIGGIKRHYRGAVELVRDVREYRAAKRARGDRRGLMLRAEAEATSRFDPANYRDFRRYLDVLTGNPHLWPAAERLLGLEHALMRRHAVPLPRPRTIEARADTQLGVFWGPEGSGITVLAGAEGLAGLIGGTAGKPLRGPAPQLLDALAFHARIAA